jgi:hypothetical protein
MKAEKEYDFHFFSDLNATATKSAEIIVSLIIDLVGSPKRHRYWLWNRSLAQYYVLKIPKLRRAFELSQLSLVHPGKYLEAFPL